MSPPVDWRESWAMADPILDISVIVPTHNRCAGRLRTLDALSRQTLAPDRFEVIVAMDAVSDGTAAALAARNWPFALTAVVPEGRGAAAARNAGAARAAGARLVFLDDDIVADPGFLAAHLAAAATAGRDAVVIGQSAPVAGHPGWFGQAVAGWWRDQFRAMVAPGHRFSYHDVMSGNLSVRRDTFAGLGGFDTALRCREDFELGYRMVKADLHLCHAPDARGLHHDASDPARNLLRARAEGHADAQIAAKHPELFAVLGSAHMALPTRGATVLRALTFQSPGFGGAVLRTAAACLPVLRILGLRRAWGHLAAQVRALAYHQGVAEAVGSLDAYRRLAVLADAVPDFEPVICEVDATGDIGEARARIAMVRPDGLRVMAGPREIANIPARTGSERLEARHLDAILHDGIWHWAPARSLSPMLEGLPADPPAWLQSPSPPASPAAQSLATLDISGWKLTPKEDAPGFPLRILVRHGAAPAGWIWLMSPPAPGQFWQVLRQSVLADRAICRRLLRDGMIPDMGTRMLPGITVVVCTRDRTDNLRRCVAALAALDYPDFEILIVDNAPATDATRLFVAAHPRLRYACEPNPGLDWARNRGIAEARHGIVAFTDDDTQADRHWLTGLADAFADPDVDLVTGLVVPMKLDTDARVYFEDVYGGMGKGFDAFQKNCARLAPRDLLWASGFGVGANMAFRKTLLDRIGPFDPALDVGTPTRGGGDIEMFHRAVARGGVLAYQPAAFVWHEHRADLGGLKRQLADNGCGFAGYLLTCARNRTVARSSILAFALRNWIGDWLIKRLIRPGRHKRGLVLDEMRGLRQGYHGYRQARARAAELALRGTAALSGERATET